MDTSRKICTVLTDSDLSPQNIQATIETIEKSPNRFFLLSLKNGSRLWNVIEDLKAGKIGAKTLTKIRMAYNLEFKLQTIFKTSNDFSAEGNAPTSSLLPTPNTVKYIPSVEDSLCLITRASDILSRRLTS